MNNINPSRACEYLRYLALATKQVNDEIFEHKKHEIELKKIKRMNFDKEIEKKLNKIEKEMKGYKDKEKKISVHQKHDEKLEHSLHTKIVQLEHKLNGYIKRKETRVHRLRELEKKIKNKLTPKHEMLAALHEKFKEIEDIYKHLKKEKNPPNLNRLEKIIKKLKDKFKKISKDL